MKQNCYHLVGLIYIYAVIYIYIYHSIVILKSLLIVINIVMKKKSFWEYVGIFFLK